MGVIAWIAVGLAAGLLANMMLAGRRSPGLIFTGLTGITAVLGGDWTASLLRAQGLASVPGWLAALAERIPPPAPAANAPAANAPAANGAAAS